MTKVAKINTDVLKWIIFGLTQNNCAGDCWKFTILANAHN